MNQYSSSFQPSDVFSATSYTNDEFSLSNCRTVVEVLGWRSSTQGNQDIFTFLLDGETEQARLTYQELDRLARRTAAQLQAMGLVGERALLLYPAGLDFLIAFFGCLYAGVVAVTAYPPRNQRNTPRIQAIAQDAQAAIALTTTDILPTVQSLISQRTDLGSLQWLTTDNITPGIEDNWQQPHIDQDSLAFLQYTSGSTGTPKGVMISHGNLLHNAQTTRQFMEHSSASKFVTWLPMYHDMGLIGGILQPLYGGFPCIIMPPAAFLQRPYRWLQAISHYRGTTSGGPNFAYDLCVQKITPEQKATLDLSSWSVAFNGAEPIRYDTLERFAEAFAECGFRKEAFYPCYGMAETTLMVAGVQKAAPPKIKALQKSALASHQVVESSVVGGDDTSYFVSCGQIIPDQKVVITNPDTLKSCQPDEIGEIWVAGLSVGQGYWHRPAETAETFGAYLADTGEGPFLRTGDLGFLQDGELFITGRAKDLIIIRGRNLYPQDIELTAERSHSSLRPGANAAFTVVVNNEEKLVVVQELEFRAKPNLETVINTIRQAVTEEHEVQVYAVVLIKPGTICKTSSGKIQRRATRAQFENGELSIVASNILKASDIVQESIQLQRSQLLTLATPERQTVLEQYLIVQIANVLAIAPDNIPLQAPLSTLGLDSLKVFELKNRVEVDLEVEISIADLFAGMSPRSLATKILTQITTAELPSITLTRQPKNTSVHPLSFAQQGLWFIHQLNLDSPTYNIPLVIHLQGCVNLTALKESLNAIIQRHEVLRTSFTEIDGQPSQVINQTVFATLTIEDLLSLPESQRHTAAQSLATEFAQQPFDFSAPSLLCVKLVQLNDKDYQLLITLHHIIADGWSIGILIQELAALYEAFSHNKLSPLAELPIQYQDVVYWQQKSINCDRIQSSLAYWQQKLQGELPVLNLPTDRPRPPVQTFKGAQAKLVFSRTLTEALKHLSRQQEVTLFMTLLTAFKILLYRYTGQTDIVVGSPIAHRHKAEINSLIGLFVNVLVLRTDLSGDLSFQELLTRVKATALEAYVHQDLPFEKLVEALQPNRDLSYNPLFQVMFVLQNLPKPNLNLSDVSIRYEEGHNSASKFDLTLFMEDSDSGLIAICEYNTDLFNPDTITRMLGHFQNLLESVVSNPQQPIADLKLLTPPEIQQLLVDWNNTQTNYPEDKCIHQLFEAQVETTPNAVAVVFDNQQLTYQEVNHRANQLAHYLQKLSVKPDDIVGVCIKRSPEMLIALLAIFKAGGAYVPLDPAYPQERLAFMLKDSQSKVLLTQSQLGELFATSNLDIVCIDRDLDLLRQQSKDNLLSEVKPHHLAYVIYTSGSTGVPKGVAIEHQSCVALLTWSREVFTDKDLAGVLASTSICFDLSVFELFVPLSWGGKVILVENALHLPSLTTEVSLVNTVPSIITELVQIDGIPSCVRIVNLAGEPLQNYLVQQIYQKHHIQKVFNLYGPSEDTTYSTFTQVNQDDKVTIGRPIANTQVYLLDSNLKPVPIGVPGEIYLGGAGLARGYLNRPNLTQEKFISNPFSNKLESRLYKTGDLARYLPDGNLEYLGRIDHQVKIRGFRIELGEIENALLKHPAIEEVVVAAREDKQGDKQLVVYIVSSPEPAPTINDLRIYLKKLLPEYMVPGVFIFLDTLPLLPNGKVDRRALPVSEIARPKLTTTSQAPQSAIEQKIAKLWQEVLNLDQVGIHDNFFDLGGHSLLMLKINNQLRTMLQQDISVVTLFQHPTIYSLAQYLSQTTENETAFDILRDRIQKQKAARNKYNQLRANQTGK
ncbi:non-ribosomal peptide synthetase [Nostoc sp. FACHB-190]|uniref:non-ribosomal peptide synthetase n=1 Tax=Nostoc sp. FACHB-190 TaxID=2692838 RepID=UPI001687FCF7|nr:non-ribosomal peptide synthetase [Nostoc sp. FACHB-190]MBD2298139.1 amino acid adenylation domain-containing protein [Nostoc sp. FACHB-190]